MAAARVASEGVAATAGLVVASEGVALSASCRDTTTELYPRIPHFSDRLGLIAVDGTWQTPSPPA